MQESALDKRNSNHGRDDDDDENDNMIVDIDLKSPPSLFRQDTRDNLEEENEPIPRSTYLFAFCASLNSAIIGFDVGVSTEAARLVQTTFGLDMTQREAFVGCLNFFAMFGALAAQHFTDQYGRRRTFLVSSGGFMLGVTIMAVATSFPVLMVGRGIIGVAVGTGLAIDPIYIAEVTPAHARGQLVSWTEIAVNIGLSSGFALTLLVRTLSTEVQWRLMFALGNVLPAILIVLVTTVMPESPRWLVQQKKYSEARSVLRQIYPNNNRKVSKVMHEIDDSLSLENVAKDMIGWVDILFRPTPAFKRMLWVGVSTTVAQQAVGIDALQYYLLDVLVQAGIKTYTKRCLMLIFLGLIKLAFVFVGSTYFDRVGRRIIFFISLWGMAFSMVLVAFAFISNDPSSKSVITIVGLGFYLAFFSIGAGPGGWLVPSEVFSNVIRAKAMSVATFLNRVTATLMASTFLSTAKLISWPGFFLLIAAICIITFVYLYIYLPETKGHSLEEMTQYFATITGDTTILEAERELMAKRRAQQELGTYHFGDESPAPSRRPSMELEMTENDTNIASEKEII